MSRAPVFPVEDQVRIVLSILAGEVTVPEAARRAKVSELARWTPPVAEASARGEDDDDV